MLVDTHAHLSDLKFSGDVDQVINRAVAVGVERIICPASNLADVQKIAAITNEYEMIYGLAGLYPGEGQKSKNWRGELTEIEKLILSTPKLLGVGEIGLDSYWNERDEKLEREIFRSQLEMAVRINKPVVIHNRLSHRLIEDTFTNMHELPGGQFHCFTGTHEFLDYILGLGFYVGFDGNITYPSNHDLRELVKLVPSDRLLLETDSPYLPPQGKRGERNEPANVRITAQIIADLRGVSLKVLGEQTTANAKRLFNL